MSFVKIPNLCGANSTVDALLAEAEKTINTHLDKMEKAAEEEVDEMLGDIKEQGKLLGKSLKAMLPELPSIPGISLQAELKALEGFVVGSAQYVEKLAALKGQFGSLIDLDAIGGADICTLANLTLPSGGTSPIKQAFDTKLSLAKEIVDTATDVPKFT